MNVCVSLFVALNAAFTRSVWLKAEPAADLDDLTPKNRPEIALRNTEVEPDLAFLSQAFLAIQILAICRKLR